MTAAASCCQWSRGDALFEAAAEMGQDQLPDLGALASRMDQAVGDATGFALGTGFDAPDEHGTMVPHWSHSVNMC